MLYFSTDCVCVSQLPKLTAAARMLDMHQIIVLVDTPYMYANEFMYAIAMLLLR